MLGVMDRLNNILVVSGEVEEATTLPRRSKLRQNILPGKGHQVVGRIQPKEGAKMSEDPGRIILELEVILG